MMCTNPKLDLVNINVYAKFGKFRRFVCKILNGNEIMKDGQTDRQTEGQPKSSKASLFKARL